MKSLMLTALLGLSYLFVFSNNSDSAQYYYNKGLQENKDRLFAQAAISYDKAIEFNPQFALAYLAKAKVSIQMSRMYDAGQNFLKAYELDPGNPEVIQELTIFYFNNRQYQKCIEFAEKCVGCELTERMLGMSYYELEDYGKAEKFLKIALKKNEHDAEASYTLGRTYLELENGKSALEFYQKAVTSAPTRFNWLYELGLLYYNSKEYKNALTYFDKAAKAGVQKGNDFLENYGFAQIYSGDAEAGVKTLETVLNKKPNNKELLNNIAYAMYTTKRYEAAITFYEKLLTLNANDASSLFMAGMTFQKMGQKEKGQAICDKAIEMDPSLARNRQKKEMPMGL
ncbi:MAG: tetratricopeptide repeat protein [Ginsengibacter sp.]